MYANAIYKPRSPKDKTLKIFIQGDKEQAQKNHPDIQILKAADLVTADGKKLPSFTFFPTTEGNWERVSYADEGDFYLIFTLSARTKAGYDKAVLDYQTLIKNYKEKP